jgi:hypothetical protein
MLAKACKVSADLAMNPTTQIQTGVLTVFMPNDQSAIAQHSTHNSTAQHSTSTSTAQHSTCHFFAILPFLFPFFLSAFCSLKISFLSALFHFVLV